MIADLLNHPHVIKIVFLSLSGIVIRQSLVISGQRWANTYHHLATYLLLPGIAFVITKIIKQDIALSLGMIGAMSIVRFRNPVKSALELVMYFALITIGIAASVRTKWAIQLIIIILAIIFGVKLKLGLILFVFSLRFNK